ncbi:SLC13 family permease [Treponema pedis]|uniref:SLC13 family permease n=1 Tax=Treponema pedis TaxID=409322 RepID=UPI00041FD6C3|nr:SLC13 family permease [Treponema pedis]
MISNPIIIPSVLFCITYILMITLTNYRPIIACSSALLFVILGILPYNEVFFAIDWNVILMIAGTMGLVALFTESKMPQRIADKIINNVPDVKWIIVCLSLFAGFISAFMDNVATVLMLAPIAVVLSKKLNIPPVKPIIAISISANLQGAATLVGDTTSILLGSQLNMTFFDFFWYLGKPSLFFAVEISAVAATAIIYFIFRKANQKPDKVEPVKVTDYFPSILLIVMVILMIGASFLPEDKKPQIINGLICISLLAAGIIYNLIKNKNFEILKTVKKELSFETLFLLAGLFIVIAAVTEAGVIKAIADGFLKLGNNVFLIYTIIVWGSVLISAFVDNIPYVAAMIPIIEILSTNLGIASPILFFGLLSGATLGGNITPIGASANITSLGILRGEGYQVKNSEFMKLSVPYTLVAVAIGYILIWITYGV